MDILFPYTKIRPIQKEVVEDIAKAINNKEHLILHAPTGLGKSAAVLSASVPYALKNAYTIFFLTSRHTQHEIVIRTLKEMSKKYKITINVADIIGKRWMCMFQNVDELSSMEFTDFCKATVEAGRCEFYSNTHTNFKLSVVSKKILSDIKQQILHVQDVISICKHDMLCPYELTLELVRGADVVVGDYAYVFHPIISEFLFKKTGKSLDKAIVIVDEGHNLPTRVRSSASIKLTSIMLKNAVKEAKKYQYKETSASLVHLQNVLNNISEMLVVNQQRLIKKQEFIDAVNAGKDYQKFVDDLNFIAESVRQVQRKSTIGGVARFLEAWQGNDEGYARILEVSNVRGGMEVRDVRNIKDEKVIALHYKCLDPSILTKNIIEQSHSTIIMSGTLVPTNMYCNILGFDDERTIKQVYDNPFPEKNRLALVVPKTTTKFTERCEQQYNAIAEECSKIINAVEGNSIIFFPSYAIRDSVDRYFSILSKKTILKEAHEMNKNEKEQLLDKFKSYKDAGAVLLATVSGSYGEGIDMPGEFLKCVIVVGLPLLKPNLETKELINYFEKKFRKGWDYGYLFPAFNKALQNAGRCIRSETDKGVIVFLDVRYAWPMYRRLFPEDMHVEMSTEPAEDIRLFFGNKKYK